jgi:hypothetical protein
VTERARPSIYHVPSAFCAGPLARFGHSLAQTGRVHGTVARPPAYSPWILDTCKWVGLVSAPLNRLRCNRLRCNRRAARRKYRGNDRARPDQEHEQYTRPDIGPGDAVLQQVSLAIEVASVVGRHRLLLRLVRIAAPRSDNRERCPPNDWKTSPPVCLRPGSRSDMRLRAALGQRAFSPPFVQADDGLKRHPRSLHIGSQTSASGGG